VNLALAQVERWNLGLSASAVAASFALETPHFATSLAAGALLEAINLGALRRSALRFFQGEMSRSWTGAFALRFLLLAAGIFLTLRVGADPVALLIGLSIAMPAVLIDAWINRPPILDPATLPVLLDEDLDDDAREAAELADRDERLSLTGSLTGSLVGRFLPTGFAPPRDRDDAPGASRAPAERDPALQDRTQPRPDETRR